MYMISHHIIEYGITLLYGPWSVHWPRWQGPASCHLFLPCHKEQTHLHSMPRPPKVKSKKNSAQNQFLTIRKTLRCGYDLLYLLIRFDFNYVNVTSIFD